MHILSIIIFAISSSSDNLIVGLRYGSKKIKMNFFNTFVVSFISGMGTFLAMLFGKLLIQLIPLIYTNIIGSSILILLGLYLLIISLKKGFDDNSNLEEVNQNISDFYRYEATLRSPEIIDANHSKTIEFKESIMLGFLLCLNNIGFGIGASITGLNICITSIFSLIFSLAFISLGYYIGEKIFSNNLSKYSEVISAFIIIALGIYELFI